MNDIKWIDIDEFRPGNDMYCKNKAFIVKGDTCITLKEEYMGSSDHIPQLKIDFYSLINRDKIRADFHSLDNAQIVGAEFYCCKEKVKSDPDVRSTLYGEYKDSVMQARIKDKFHRLVLDNIEKHSDEIHCGSMILFHEKIKEWCEEKEYIFTNGCIKYWAGLKKELPKE